MEYSEEIIIQEKVETPNADNSILILCERKEINGDSN